ncbi:MAG: aminotransferase class IV [Pseudomonadota bacterium]
MTHIFINNKIVLAHKATISVQDRGFRFGDGVFETCLIFGGKIYNWQAHQARLKAGLKAIKINFADKNLQQSCLQIIEKNKIQNGYLRINISRGVGSVGYLPQKNIQPTIVIETLPLNPQPKSPIKLCISTLQKPSLKSLPVNYKLSQGLNSTLAKLEAVEQNCFDAIILNNKKQICETSSANIFWIKDNILYTPHPDCGCLLGTIREKILELSPIKIKLAKAKITDLLNADEAFITNVAIGVLAVDKIAESEFKNKKYSKIFANLLDEDIKN